MATVMDKGVSKIISVEEAAEIIGCTDNRIRQLLRAGTLPGNKIGERVWMILRKDAEKFARIPQETGRPRISSKTA